MPLFSVDSLCFGDDYLLVFLYGNDVFQFLAAKNTTDSKAQQQLREAENSLDRGCTATEQALNSTGAVTATWAKSWP